jgi:hypothetical protein
MADVKIFRGIGLGFDGEEPFGDWAGPRIDPATRFRGLAGALDMSRRSLSTGGRQASQPLEIS